MNSLKENAILGTLFDSKREECALLGGDIRLKDIVSIGHGTFFTLYECALVTNYRQSDFNRWGHTWAFVKHVRS